MRFTEFKSPDTEIEFPALDQIMKNTGYPTFNYQLFKTIYDRSETLKNVVDDFDQEKIIVKTDKQAEKDPAMDFDKQGSTDVVKKMAKLFEDAYYKYLDSGYIY